MSNEETKTNGRQFNPANHVINIGKKNSLRLYLPVKARIQWARDPSWKNHFNHEFGIEIEELEHDRSKGYAKIKATIRARSDGFILAQDVKTESVKDFSDYYEKATTGAIGRALAGAGFGTKYALEMEGEAEANRPVDGPMQDKKQTAPPNQRVESSGSDHNGSITKAQIATMSKLMEAYKITGEEFRQWWGEPAQLTFKQAGKILDLLSNWPSLSAAERNALCANGETTKQDAKEQPAHMQQKQKQQQQESPNDEIPF